MMKSVLISIQPKWCELIADGKKTVEVRKTRPKLETPFKCYIYCTESQSQNLIIFKVRESYFDDWGHLECFLMNKRDTKCFDKEYRVNGKVIGEFVCDKLVWVVSHPSIFAGHDLLHKAAIEAACLTTEEAEKYADGKDVFGWHISNLVIYDKPRELSEFYRECEEPNCDDCPHLCVENTPDYYEIYCIYDEKIPITRPPQSWCYVESEERNNG